MDPDLTYSVEVPALLVKPRVACHTEPSPPPPGVLHGDLLRAGPGPAEPKVPGDAEGPGASHPRAVRGGPVQTGRDRLQRHPGPDGRRQQGPVGFPGAAFFDLLLRV